MDDAGGILSALVAAGAGAAYGFLVVGSAGVVPAALGGLGLAMLTFASLIVMHDIVLAVIEELMDL